MSETKKQDFFKSDAFKMFVGKYGIGAVLIAMMIIIAVLEPAFVKPTNFYFYCYNDIYVYPFALD